MMSASAVGEGGLEEAAGAEADSPPPKGWEVAAEAIKLALNNRVEDAQDLLDQSKASCVHRQAGYCYLAFINAVMTFEEEKMSLALSTLRTAEKRCTSDISWSPSFNNLQQTVKSRLWRLPSREKTAEEVTEATALKLEQQIILADCQVLAAIINFLHQDWGSYMKGGWVLRKAWKIYQRAYSQIRELYMKRVGLSSNSLAPPPPSNLSGAASSLETPTTTTASVFPGEAANRNRLGKVGSSKKSNGSTGSGSGTSEGSASSPSDDEHDEDSSESPEIPSIRSTKKFGGGPSGVSQSFSVPLNLFALVRSESKSSSSSSSDNQSSSLHLPPPSETDLLPPATVKRLMSAVSFGYGIFHLAVSLLPPKLLNVIHFLGFEGDRSTGIQALHFARQGNDMRGPIATLALLWFHTIVRPFFGLDGSNLRSGSDAAQRLIDGSKADFADSALFLFFQGRVDRLKCNFRGALASYERALSVSAQREVRLLCLHEVGWSYVLLLKWDKSSVAFLKLKQQSRWSKSFYTYLSAVCLGCCGQIRKSLELAMETPSLVKRPNNPLGKFLVRRAQRMVQENIDQQFCLLLGYELLYLWNALGACLKQSHRSIQIDCERIRVPALEGVRRLILGSVCNNAGDLTSAQSNYLAAIDEGEALGDVHASAFASYELGMLVCKNASTMTELDEGRVYLERARDNYQNYDFENRLCVRIHSALRFYSSLTTPPMANAAIDPDNQQQTTSMQQAVTGQASSRSNKPPPTLPVTKLSFKETQL